MVGGTIEVSMLLFGPKQALRAQPGAADTEARANTGRNPHAIALLWERTLVAPHE